MLSFTLFTRVEHFESMAPLVTALRDFSCQSNTLVFFRFIYISIKQYKHSNSLIVTGKTKRDHNERVTLAFIHLPFILSVMRRKEK